MICVRIKLNYSSIILLNHVVTSLRSSFEDLKPILPRFTSTDTELNGIILLFTRQYLFISTVCCKNASSVVSYRDSMFFGGMAIPISSIAFSEKEILMNDKQIGVWICTKKLADCFRYHLKFCSDIIFCIDRIEDDYSIVHMYSTQVVSGTTNPTIRTSLRCIELTTKQCENVEYSIEFSQCLTINFFEHSLVFTWLRSFYSCDLDNIELSIYLNEEAYTQNDDLKNYETNIEFSATLEDYSTSSILIYECISLYDYEIKPRFKASEKKYYWTFHIKYYTMMALLRLIKKLSGHRGTKNSPCSIIHLTRNLLICDIKCLNLQNIFRISLPIIPISD